MISATRYLKLVPMTYQELKARSHSLRLIAERNSDLPNEELLDSFDETMDHMTGPQRRSPSILADMTRWLLQIELDVDNTQQTQELATASK